MVLLNPIRSWFSTVYTRILSALKLNAFVNQLEYRSANAANVCRLKVGMHCTDTVHNCVLKYIHYFVYFCMHAVAKG